MNTTSTITHEIDVEIRKKWKSLTNEQLFKHLIENFGFKGKLTTMRTYMYNNDMKKTNCLRWKPEEVEYLLANYGKKGNMEIAKKLSTKKRPVHKKNVEKKMVIMKLKRTPEQLFFIKDRHIKQGVYKRANEKNWENRKIKEGQKVIRLLQGRVIVMIKVGKHLVHYARYRYKQIHGEIAPGMKIHFKDSNPLNVEDYNLEVRKGCSYSKEEKLKYFKHCRDYIQKEKTNAANKVEPVTVKEVNPIKTNGLITIRINDRTTIQVKPGSNIEAIKQRYGMQSLLSNART